MPVKRQTIVLKVDGNTLSATDPATGAAVTDAGVQGEDGAVWLHAQIPDDWQGLMVRLRVDARNGVFDESGAAVENCIDMPLRGLVTAPGRLTVTLLGCDGTGVRKTADCRSLFIAESDFLPDDIARKFPIDFENLADCVENGVVHRITGSGGALVTKSGKNVYNVNVTGTGGDMLQANYSNGSGFTNINRVDRAVYAENAPLSALYFGAKGDGSTDDRAALQSAIDYAYDKGIGKVFLPKGTYRIGAPIYLWGGSECGRNAVLLEGDSVNTTAIRKDNHAGPAAGTYAGTDAIIILADRTQSATSAFYRQQIKNLLLDGTVSGTDKTEYGILGKNKGAYVMMENVTVIADTCIQFQDDLWQSGFKNLLLYPGAKGFSMLASGTSNHIDKAFVNGCKQCAFELRGIYSSADSLAADNCTGTVYAFYYASWTVNGIGNEGSPDAAVCVDVDFAHVVLQNACFFGQTGEKSCIFNVWNSSKLDVMCATVGSGQASKGKLFALASPASSIAFMDVEISDTYAANSTSNSFDNTVTFVNRESSYNMRLSENSKAFRTFIGYNGRGKMADQYDASPNVYANAIFFAFDADGEDTGWSPNIGAGDILLTRKMLDKGVLGWVCTGAGADYLRNCKLAPIPLALSGTTALRPKSPETGAQYFDSTLGKPVWWNGAAWVDAAGTSC